MFEYSTKFFEKYVFSLDNGNKYKFLKTVDGIMDSMLNRVTEVVKSGLEDYRQYNKPCE